jgi:hypothetical protein
MVAGRCSPRDLYINKRASVAKVIFMYQLLGNFRQFVNIVPDDPGLVQAAAQAVHMTIHIEKVATIPSHYLIYTVAKEKATVIRTKGCFVTVNKTSVKVNCVHMHFNKDVSKITFSLIWSKGLRSEGLKV